MNDLLIDLEPLPGEAGLALAARQPSVDASAARTLGRAVLRRAIGLARPRFWYHVGCTVHAAPELDLFHRQRTLLLGNDHTGSSEWAGAAFDDEALGPAARAGVLRLMLRAALLAMAAGRGHWAPRLVAELPGVRDAAGASPFWDGLGRPFCRHDPAALAAEHGTEAAGWVAPLLPRHPVCTSFLPAAAQAAIGRVHDAARWQREVLEEAGLRYGHHVAITDGGPVLEADVEALPAVLAARAWRVAHAAPGEGAGGPDGPEPTPWLAFAPAAGGGGRAARVAAATVAGRLRLDAADRDRLGLPPDGTPGPAVWALPLRPGDEPR